MIIITCSDIVVSIQLKPLFIKYNKLRPPTEYNTESTVYNLVYKGLNMTTPIYDGIPVCVHYM